MYLRGQKAAPKADHGDWNSGSGGMIWWVQDGTWGGQKRLGVVGQMCRRRSVVCRYNMGIIANSDSLASVSAVGVSHFCGYVAMCVRGAPSAVVASGGQGI